MPRQQTPDPRPAAARGIGDLDQSRRLRRPGAKLLELSDGRTFAVARLRMLDPAGFGSGNVVGDPRLVLSGPLRWSTRPGSPARNLGELVAGLSHDLYGGFASWGRHLTQGPSRRLDTNRHASIY
jgi:hypothetical protein